MFYMLKVRILVIINNTKTILMNIFANLRNPNIKSLYSVLFSFLKERDHNSVNPKKIQESRIGV